MTNSDSSSHFFILFFYGLGGYEYLTRVLLLHCLHWLPDFYDYV